jgi:hypothetical protein
MRNGGVDIGIKEMCAVRWALSMLAGLAMVISLGMCSKAAAAEINAPGWEATGHTAPTNLPPGETEGILKLSVYNFGAAESSAGAVLTATLPEGVTVTEIEPLPNEFGPYLATCSGDGSRTVRCELPNVPPGGAEKIHVKLLVADDAAPGNFSVPIKVVGGGALTPTDTTMPFIISSVPAGPGFSNFVVWATNSNGTIDTQAGSHPYDFVVDYALNTNLGPFFGVKTRQEFAAGGQLRTINVNLPPGLVGVPTAVPQCTRKELDESVYFSSKCPLDSIIGENRATADGIDEGGHSAVYNMVPPSGVAAQFAFVYNGEEVFLDSGVRSGGDNGITTHVRDVPENEVTINITKIWGVPGDERHDEERCTAAVIREYPAGGCPTGVPAKPLLTLGTSCGGPVEFIAEELGTWEEENLVLPPARYVQHDNEGNPVGWTGCGKLRPFAPSISIAPDTSASDTPAGLGVDVKMPQGLNPEGLQTPGLQKTTVLLPVGVVVNPGQATGLVACQPSQEALGTLPDGEVNEEAPSCPAASKVGTVEVTTPLLANKLQGSVYILSSDPPNLQLLLAPSGEGVNLKLVANVHLNEQTGQLVTTVENTPDAPFTDFKLNFSGGAQAALATPTKCGIYESSSEFEPWSAPIIENTFDTDRFEITSGPNGAACQWPLPFSPSMTAGATTDQAGGYTDFTMLLQRADGQQRIERLQFKTPEGLLGMIAKVPLCGEPQAAQGTCPVASQIGHTIAEAGPGPYPFVIPEPGAPPAPIYLTGPYDGAPYGLSIAVPVVAGPFNLGTEVVRAKIEVDPYTSQLTITTTAFPETVKGIPTDIREIDAVIDRPEFMFNPTDCAPMSFSGTAYSTEGASAPLESHFQVGSCQSLKFAPDFTVSTSGKTSRANGASLTAKIVYPTGELGDNQATSQANIRSVKVDLPKQLPSRLTTLQKACPAKTFDANPASCPAASIVGHGKAITSLLPVPVEGPAYFVSHAGEEFPNLIVVLQGDNVTVDLVGDTFIDNKTSITSSTFKEVPDVPIQSFELNLPQGKYSALAANGNLCKNKLVMPTAFTGQNGAVIHQSTKISVTGCPRAKKGVKAKTKRKRGKGSRR